MGGLRSMTLFATTSVVTLVSEGRPIYGLPIQQVAFQTTASLVTLLAGFLVFGRLRRNSRLNELALWPPSLSLLCPTCFS